MLKRRRFTQSKSLKDRLIAFAKCTRERAEQLPPGARREDLLKKAREADAASHINERISAGLQPPR
jgi:hypothetical protein